MLDLITLLLLLIVAWFITKQWAKDPIEYQSSNTRVFLDKKYCFYVSLCRRVKSVISSIKLKLPENINSNEEAVAYFAEEMPGWEVTSIRLESQSLS